MKKYVLLIGVALLAALLAWPAMSQPPAGGGPGYASHDDWYCPGCGAYGGPWRGRGWGPGGMMGYGMGPGMMGYGMGPGMMGYGPGSGNGPWGNVPQKIQAPKSQEWIGKLREVLALEKQSFNQYSADAEKYNTYMPYRMVIPQEQDHIFTLERLFAAYGLTADAKPAAVVETGTLQEAYGLSVKLERDLIARYEWLVKNAEDDDTGGILSNVLIQTRYHLAMFEHALQVGGSRGGRWGWRGHGPGMMRGW